MRGPRRSPKIVGWDRAYFESERADGGPGQPVPSPNAMTRIMASPKLNGRDCRLSISATIGCTIDRSSIPFSLERSTGHFSAVGLEVFRRVRPIVNVRDCRGR